MVRVTGFEPAASWSQTTRATSCATPGYKLCLIKPRALPPCHKSIPGPVSRRPANAVAAVCSPRCICRRQRLACIPAALHPDIQLSQDIIQQGSRTSKGKYKEKHRGYPRCFCSCIFGLSLLLAGGLPCVHCKGDSDDTVGEEHTDVL